MEKIGVFFFEIAIFLGGKINFHQCKQNEDYFHQIFKKIGDLMVSESKTH